MLLGDVIDDRLTALRQDAAVRGALARIRDEDADTIADQRTATEIPAPLRGEAQRAAWLAERLRAAGTEPPVTDAEGNVLATLPGDPQRPPIVLAAHLDTVFPAATDVRVRAQDDRLLAPGIADNARGLAALVRAAYALRALPRRHSLLFVGTVGEEGAGDLRGVKHLFASGLHPAAFLAVDGAGVRRIVHRAVGSRRLRVRITGPGGHSWSDRERPNPVHALGYVLTRLDSLRQESRTLGVQVGRIGGGTSINAIPAEAWLELDLRAESTSALAELEQHARAIVSDVVASVPPLQSTIECFGDRPGGILPADHVLVHAAAVVTRSFGIEPELVASSTDANVPLGLGLPALALGAGGEAGGTHTLAEWFRNDQGYVGIQRLVLLVLLVDQLA